MEKKVKVLLVEDDNDFAFLIRKTISNDGRLEYTGHAQGGYAAIKMAQQLRPDVVLMDLNLSGSEIDGVETAKEIKLTTGAKILLLTSCEQQEIVINASKRAFASGYIFKSQCKGLADTVYETAVSTTPQELFIKELLIAGLSPAERSVFDDMIDGRINTLTASSIKTIANQKTSIFKKLGVKSTSELTGIFRKWRL